MAVYHQTRATIQGQNHQPPLDQTHWTPPTTHVPPQDIPQDPRWYDQNVPPQDIPQDPRWYDPNAPQEDTFQDPRWYDPNAPQDTPPLSTPPGAPIHDEAWAYGVLHVHPTATRKQIDRAYWFIAATWNPDSTQTPEERTEKEDRLRELNEAIAILRKAKPDTP